MQNKVGGGRREGGRDVARVVSLWFKPCCDGKECLQIAPYDTHEGVGTNLLVQFLQTAAANPSKGSGPFIPQVL